MTLLIAIITTLNIGGPENWCLNMYSLLKKILTSSIHWPFWKSMGLVRAVELLLVIALEQYTTLQPTQWLTLMIGMLVTILPYLQLELFQHWWICVGVSVLTLLPHIVLPFSDSVVGQWVSVIRKRRLFWPLTSMVMLLCAVLVSSFEGQQKKPPHLKQSWSSVHKDNNIPCIEKADYLTSAPLS